MAHLSTLTIRLTVALLCGLLLAGHGAIAPAATLDSFEIEASDNQVNIHLHGDEVIAVQAPQPYQGGTAIILPNTQLSARLVKQGLPVVMDGQARFIGRAVPMGANQVKILLPNVPANRIPVHISQSTVQIADPHPAASRDTHSQVVTLNSPDDEVAPASEVPANSVVSRLPEVIASGPRTRPATSRAKTIEFAAAPAQPVVKVAVKPAPKPATKPVFKAQAQPAAKVAPAVQAITPSQDYLKQAYALLPKEAPVTVPDVWDSAPDALAASPALPADWSLDSLTPPEPTAPPDLYLDMPSAMLAPLTPAANPNLSVLNTDWYTRQALDQLEAQLAAASEQAHPPWILMLLGLAGLGASVVGLGWLIRRQLQLRQSQAKPAPTRLPFSIESVSLRPKLGWASVPKKLPFEPPMPQVLSLTPRAAYPHPNPETRMTSPLVAQGVAPSLSPRLSRPGLSAKTTRKTAAVPLAGATAS